jgi:hypothetical protein
MTKRQLLLAQDLDNLLDVCRMRGITSYHLRAPVHESCTYGLFTDSLGYQKGWERADEISKSGLSAQLSFLREAWGMKKLENFLNNTGGVLDAIVRATSSTPEELSTDEGRENINADGDVI